MTKGSNVFTLNGSDVLQKLLGLGFALIIFAAGASSAPALAQPAAPTPHAAASPAVAPDERKAREVAATAESLVSEFEVNGLKVLVKRRAGSQTVAAGLFVRGGARNVTAETAGVEALMWDVATEASAGFPREALRKETSRMGSQISYGVNYDYSALSMISTRPNFERTWEIFADVALRPAFAADDFKRVQSRMVIARQGETDTPDAYLQVLQSRAAYAGHPYTNDPAGTAETVARFRIEDIRSHHQRVMQTSRLLLVVVGDLDAAALRQHVAATFGKLPRGDYRAEPAPQLAFSAATVEFTPPKSPIPTNYIQGVFAAPALTDADIHAMRIASQVLNDRVLLEVRFRRNLSYAPSAFLRDQGAGIGGVYVTADHQKANEAVAVMLSEINKLQREPVAPDDLAAQINGYLTRYYIDQETNAAQAGELARYELIGGGWRNSLRLFESLRAVTPADIQRVARKYMRNLRFVVIGDPSRVDKNLFTTQVSG